MPMIMICNDWQANNKHLNSWALEVAVASDESGSQPLTWAAVLSKFSFPDLPHRWRPQVAPWVESMMVSSWPKSRGQRRCNSSCACANTSSGLWTGTEWVIEWDIQKGTKQGERSSADREIRWPLVTYDDVATSWWWWWWKDKWDVCICFSSFFCLFSFGIESFSTLKNGNGIQAFGKIPD